MATMNEAGVANDPPKKAESVREWMGLLTGLMLVFLAAAMYGIGRAYREGYLYQLGLNLNQEPEDFYGYLYWGYAGGAPLLLLWLAVAALGLFGLAGISYAVRWLGSESKWVQARLDWWDRFPQVGPPSSHRKYSAYGILVIALGYLVFVTYLVLGQAHDSGVKRGQQVIESLAASHEANAPNKVRWIELAWSENGSLRVLAGYRLLCTETLCSIYDPAPNGGGLRVVPLDGFTDLRVFEKPSVRQALCVFTSNAPVDCSSAPRSE